jgi:hypothetical protein
MKTVMFDASGSTEDWRFTYQLLPAQGAVWDANTYVVLGMSPDYMVWDDYGLRSRAFPPASTNSDTPWFQASSRDGTGIVVLTDPNIIDILVPWNQMRQMGPGSVRVSLSLRTDDPPRRTLVLTGNLPIMDGVV